MNAIARAASALAVALDTNAITWTEAAAAMHITRRRVELLVDSSNCATVSLADLIRLGEVYPAAARDVALVLELHTYPSPRTDWDPA